MFIASSRRALCAWRSPRRWASALALCAAVAGLPTQAQSSLSLEQALRLAQDRSSLLVAQDAAAAAAREMGALAGQRPDPILKAGLNSLPVSGPDRFSLTRDSFTMLTLGVSQELTRNDKLRARSARYDREADVAVAGRAVALANLRRDTATAWLERHFQEQLRELLQAQRAETALQIEAADAAYRGGRGSQADVFAARSALAEIDDRLRQAERQIAAARTRLARWIGADAERALAAAPGLDIARLQTGSLETHLEHHPQIELLARQEQVARAEAEIAQSNRHADWSVELSYSQRGAAYSNMVSVNLSIPLQLDRKNRQDREVSAKQALAEQARALREEAAREHIAEARTWLQQWQGDRGRLAQYGSSLMPLAAQRTQAALAAYRGGGATLAAVLEARRKEIDTRIERLRLEMQAASLWAQLEYLIPEAQP